MSITHLSATRGPAPAWEITAYCGRTVEKFVDITGEGSERVTFFPHTRHLHTSSSTLKICKQCLKAMECPYCRHSLT